MHICTKYDHCSCYSLWDTDLNIELNAIVNIGVDEDADANANTIADTNADAWGGGGGEVFGISSPSQRHATDQKL